uniref:Uncharacterized protein n=1 Tax=Bracon brevicornis TaxID=1563983 RepID=A0A6V7M3F5_9HYME
MRTVQTVRQILFFCPDTSTMEFHQWILLMLVLSMMQDYVLTEVKYEVRDLENNPGIYYEPVKMALKTWKLTIDVSDTVDSQPDWAKLSTLQTYCMNITNSHPTCSQALRFEGIRTLEAEISKLQNHMKTLLREDVVERRYRRDTAPVFGFISRILGLIVGSTDYETHVSDLEKFCKKNYFYQKVYKRKKTHETALLTI